MNDDVAGRGEHRAEHVDQSDQGAADAGHAAADLFQHAGDRHRMGLDDGLGFDPAHLVDQAGIIGGEPGDLGLDAALGQAAAQPLDQPGAEGVELRDLRDVDEDVGTAAAKLFGVGHHLLEHRAQSGPSTNRQRTAPARYLGLSAPVSGRRSRLPTPRGGSLIMQKLWSGTPHCLVESVPNQP